MVQPSNINAVVEQVTPRHLNQLRAARPIKIERNRSKVMMPPFEASHFFFVLNFLIGKRNTVMVYLFKAMIKMKHVLRQINT